MLASDGEDFDPWCYLCSYLDKIPGSCHSWCARLWMCGEIFPPPTCHHNLLLN